MTSRSELSDQSESASKDPIRDSEIYAELKRIVSARGLLEKRPGYYARRIVFNLLLLSFSLTVLAVIDNLLIQIANAAFLAFVSTQIGLVGHDIGHRQVARNSRINRLLGYLHGNLLIGMSADWWTRKHNEHHSNPNQIDTDPDIDIPLLAFSQEQAIERTGFSKFVVKYQAFLFLPMLLFEAFHIRIRSIQHVLHRRAKYNSFEAVLLFVHIGGYASLLFFLPSLSTAIAFVIVHQALFGLYMGTLFAPNHKGMLVIGPDSQLDFLRRQVLTSRNVASHPIVNYWYGGLNFQIEHHLFPTMPAGNLPQAQKIIAQYCVQRQVSYHVTSVWQSYREILGYLHEVGAPLRVTTEKDG